MSLPTKLRRAIGVLLVLASGCYPEFSFQGGEGGDGGAPGGSTTARVAVGVGGSDSSTMESSTVGHMTTSTTTGMMQTTSSSSGPPVVPQVSCGPADYSIQQGWFLYPCAPGQVCCFDKVNPFGDTCATPDGKQPPCDPGYYWTLACDGPQDCEPGYECCGNVSGGTVESTGCVLDCVSPNLVLCETNADCPSGTCQVVFGDEGYDEEYKGCL